MNDRIKELRRCLHLTQEEFAARLGIKRNTIATYETGKSNPSDAAVILICKEFNVNEEWLRNGIGAMFKAEPTDELDALSARYNLKHKDYVFIEKLLKNVAFRNMLEDFCLEYAQDMLTGGVDGEMEALPSGAPELGEIDIEAEVAAYRRQLELQKKAAAESSASNGIGGAEKDHEAI